MKIINARKNLLLTVVRENFVLKDALLFLIILKIKNLYEEEIRKLLIERMLKIRRKIK